jgi:hypothetical protein
MIDPDSDPTEGRVDMTGDGVAEIGVIVGSASLPDVNGNTGIVLGGGLDGAAIAFEGRYPMAFEASELITASLSFRTAIGTLAFSSGGLLGSRGEWFSGRDAYLGTRFQVDDEIYYGWVHVIWDPESNTVNLGLSAYEDSGEAALIAPQPAEPEDFRLTLLEGTDIEAGRVELSWPMLAGKTYELQRTTDLENWETIYAVTPYIDGEEIFMDEDFDPVHSPQRFYRVKQSESSLLMLALGIPTRRRRKAGA